MADCMNKEQREYIEQIQNDMLERTNMTEQEAWDFAFRCWQCGYKKVNDNDGWIPVESGKLPVVPEGKEYVDVIITIKEPLKEPTYMYTEYYSEDGFNYLYPSFIKAWRYDTLQPYQPKGE